MLLTVLSSELSHKLNSRQGMVSDKTIVASKYQLYLPTEEQLIKEVKKEIDKVIFKSYKVNN